MKQVETPKYLSLTHLAQHCSLSVKTLRSFLHLPHNPLPHYRMSSGKILVDVEEFDAWLRRFRITTPGLDLDKIVNEMMAELL